MQLWGVDDYVMLSMGVPRYSRMRVFLGAKETRDVSFPFFFFFATRCNGLLVSVLMSQHVGIQRILSNELTFLPVRVFGNLLKSRDDDKTRNCATLIYNKSSIIPELFDIWK